MHHRYHFTHLTTASGLLLALLLLQPQDVSAQQKSSVDIFSGLEFNMRDISYNGRQYDLFISLTPGFKWDFGNHWQVAGMFYVNVLNQFDNIPDVNGNYYDYYHDSYHPVFQFGMLDVSKEFRLGGIYCKASGGFFTTSRYGLDIKAFWPVTDWFAFEGQAGLTGFYGFQGGFGVSPIQRFSGTFGGDIYFKRSNTQLRGVIGSYIYRDWGFEAEAMRHFRHSTVSLYACWNDKEAFDGGFKVVVMLPPYHRTHRTLNFRPASNFQLPYSINLHSYTNCMYNTDPEQNIRDGWFSRDFLPWGSHNMEPDYIITEKE